MSSVVTVRRGTKEDLPSIEKIVSNVVPLMQKMGNCQWDEAYPLKENFEEDIKNQVCWVAQVDNVVAAVAALTTDQSPEYAGCGWDLNIPAIVPHRVAVSPQYQRCGLGRKLMQQAETLSKENGYDRVRVDTNEMNAPMNKLFESLQFKYWGKINLNSKPKETFFNCYEKKL